MPTWAERARTFEEIRQYAKMAGKAVVFSDGMLYDAEQHMTRTGWVNEQTIQSRTDICQHVAAQALLKHGVDLL